MKFIKPKNKNAERVDWELSEQTRAIVKYYAEYIEYTEGEEVETFLLNILNDEGFIEWVESNGNKLTTNSKLLNKTSMIGVFGVDIPQYH